MNKLAAALCVLLGGSAVGCGSNAPATAPDSPESSASTHTSSLPPTSPAPTPSVEPASGTLIDGIQVTFHLPQGWRQDPAEKSWQRSFSGEQVGGIGNLFESFSNNTWPNANPQSLAEEVKRTRRFDLTPKHWRRLPDLTIAGLPAYHLVATSRNLTEERYGTLLNKRNIVFDLNWLTVASTPTQRRRLTDQILASVQVK